MTLFLVIIVVALLAVILIGAAVKLAVLGIIFGCIIVLAAALAGVERGRALHPRG